MIEFSGRGRSGFSSEGMKLLEKHTVPRSAGMSCHMPAAQHSRKLLPIRVAQQDYRHFKMSHPQILFISRWPSFGGS